MAAHHIPYVAQSAAIGNMKDLYEKAEKALYKKGPAFLNVLAPCPRGWRYNTPDLMEINKLAVDTCLWPLYEVEDGVYRITYNPKNKLPIEEFLKPQGRFKHLFKDKNRHLIDELQQEVDSRWERLLKLAGRHKNSSQGIKKEPAGEAYKPAEYVMTDRRYKTGRRRIRTDKYISFRYI